MMYSLLTGIFIKQQTTTHNCVCEELQLSERAFNSAGHIVQMPNELAYSLRMWRRRCFWCKI